MNQFFQNLKVVELAGILAGPSVGMFFAELGATVVKIENPITGGDLTRSWKMSNEKNESPVSAYFSSVNYKKKYLSLNLQDENDRNKLLIEIESADILIVNFKPGDAEKFGLHYEILSTNHPKLIYAQITGFGEHDNRPAFDVVLQAEAGFMNMNGTIESGPVKMPVALIDVLAAHQIKEGILLSLLQRERTGKGAYVRVSLYDTAITALVNQASNYLMTGQIPQRMGTLHPNIAPYGEIIHSSDNASFVLAVGSESHFVSLCAVLCISETANEFSSNTYRVQHRKKLIDILDNASRKINSKELENQFKKNKIPFGKIKNMQEIFDEDNAKKLIREEKIDGVLTKRVTSIAFNIEFYK